MAGITRIPGSLAFRVDKHIATVENANESMATTLIPFYSLHDSRHQVYWPQLDKQKFDAYAKKVKKQALQDAELAAKTIDKVTPSQQQPEVEHEFKGDNTRAGVNNGHHWRDAFGWFSYKLSNKDLNAELLRIEYFKHDINRRFVIEVNGELLAEVDLKPHSSQDDFYYIDYPLTQTMKEAKTLELKFHAKPESIAGGIYGIRLMSHPNSIKIQINDKGCRNAAFFTPRKTQSYFHNNSMPWLWPLFFTLKTDSILHYKFSVIR
ncbi:DUF6805 domain-containing protein [Psychrosphaera algicola]|uniref:Glycoside hydrolase GH146 substrate-binding domain-containing protein n=1 Tax=Psychrosphaera algicola TaxID=3023714 RepID=A0ABT5FGA4_9GAMM|nr:DUF6805 domain-containing protein [Psychrosphaera sp. G1-22]MDC2889730.1 hypothetical protein [Psychrosphaera sp. G1-22]